MQSMKDFIQSMSEEEFETNKQGLVAKRLEKPKKLSARAARYWNEIVCQQYNFNRDEIETKELKNITKENIIEFFDIYICPKSNTRKKLACYIMPSDTSEIKVETIPELEVIPENVEDVSAYKSSLPLNPVPVPLMNPKEMVRIVEWNWKSNSLVIVNRLTLVLSIALINDVFLLGNMTPSYTSNFQTDISYER